MDKALPQQLAQNRCATCNSASLKQRPSGWRSEGLSLLNLCLPHKRKNQGNYPQQDRDDPKQPSQFTKGISLNRLL